MEKQDIINYILTTPENTNPAILGGMLEQLIAQSGGGDGGDEFTPTSITFTYTGIEEGGSAEFIVKAPIVIPGPPDTGSMILNSLELTVEDGTPEIIPIIVINDYKTVVILDIDLEEEKQIGSITGDAEQVPNLGILIWGEATINLVDVPK